MASISRIEVANFLCDGFEPGMEWVPLYRGITLRLFGHSAALQVDNGGGKTSLTESCLYLLTRDRRLKPLVEDRTAPPENGWTHIRIEFTERPVDKDILQSEFITMTAPEAPGTLYVVGLCWNRGKNPYFYRYMGSLEDAPCYKQDGNRLELVGNEQFRQSVAQCSNFVWNQWNNADEWHNEIKHYTNVDAIKQNVEFQLEGAGDYSAMVTKAKIKRGELYHEAFFRKFVAPELLRQPLGTEGDSDEYRFEDALFKTLKPTAKALVEIGQYQRELDDANNALERFKPVEDRGEVVVKANEAYKKELEALTTSAALVRALVINAPLPGVPQVPSDTGWAKEARLVEVLASLTIDRVCGIVITDSNLARLLGLDTSRVNEYARDHQIPQLEPTWRDSMSQPIDFKDVLKDPRFFHSDSKAGESASQVIDFKGDLKESKRGAHRKYDAIAYDLNSALNLLEATSRLSSAVPRHDLKNLLIRAFGLAAQIDSNAYRKIAEQLKKEKQRKENDKAAYALQLEGIESELETLRLSLREAAENEIAYETFITRSDEFPEALRESPLKAQEWAHNERQAGEAQLDAYHSRVTTSGPLYSLWEALQRDYPEQSLADVHAQLLNDHSLAVTENASAQELLQLTREALDKQEGLRHDHEKVLSGLQSEAKLLRTYQSFMPTFIEIFGEVNPHEIDPPAELAKANAALREAERALDSLEADQGAIEGQLPQVAIYEALFGQADPTSLDPLGELSTLQKDIGAQQKIATEHKEYAEALDAFEASHAGMQPRAWLDAIEADRARLHTEDQQLNDNIAATQQQLEDLENFAVADERVYSKALSLLQRENIPFLRLHESICQTVSGHRRSELLTLFSSALSAPVVSSTELADLATQLLERENSTVPVFLKSRLDVFEQAGDIVTDGDIAYTYLVGRRTRQVDILLNPDLIAEEKAVAQQALHDYTLRKVAIQNELETISSTAPAVALAMKAADAVTRNSRHQYQEAFQQLSLLEPQVPTKERLAAPDSLKSIEGMKSFIALGGHTRYQHLINELLPSALIEKDRTSNHVDALSRQVAPEALEALVSVRSYYKAGGEAKLKELEHEAEEATEYLRRLLDEIQSVRTKIHDVLTPALNDASKVLREIEKDFDSKCTQLTAAIDFEKSDELAFMKSHDATREKIKTRIRTSQTALEGIDFKRADAYITVTSKADRSVADRIADAEQRKGQIKTREFEAMQSVRAIDENLARTTPFVELVHQIGSLLYTHFIKTVSLSSELFHGMSAQAASLEAHGIKDLVHTLQRDCTAKGPRTDAEVKSNLLAVLSVIQTIEIDNRQMLSAQQALHLAQNEFIKERNEFCRRARQGDIKGLNSQEIAKIEQARTIEELRLVHELKTTIASQIEERTQKLQQLNELMISSKTATVDNLVRFARQAQTNLEILNGVMQRYPTARFVVKVEIASEEAIGTIIESLIAEIEDKERAARQRKGALSNSEIEERDAGYREFIHNRIYREMFIKPSVAYIHTAIREDETLLTEPGKRISTGQHTALAMMWLVRQAEYAQVRAAKMHGNRREQKLALKGSQRIMFFDGLFSNLSNERYINAAFHGLKDGGDNFQLIGLIHSPYYVNNTDIFCVHLMGKRQISHGTQGERMFMAFEPWQQENGMIYYMSALKKEVGDGAT